MFERPILQILKKRMEEPRRFIQVLAGPRQTGKTTLAQQVMKKISFPCLYASADEPALKDRVWIEQQWETGRSILRGERRSENAILILDEIQKISGWSETVKRLWDEDTLSETPLKILLLGSSPLLVRKGLSETLAGRFEMIQAVHWTFSEMREAFGWTLEQYLFYGGYPGAAPLIEEHERWRRYILDSLVETTIARDLLLIHRVHKPEILRRLFELGCLYSSQILSYQKMLGQIQDAGNTTTLAHYLELLGQVGMLRGLPKYAGERVRQRASSPKFLALNTALMSALSNLSYEKAQRDAEFWGRFIETSVGAHLANGIHGTAMELFYWREGNREVDFILSRGRELAAIEVKSSRRRISLPGMETFCRIFPVKRKLLTGAQGIPLREFLQTPPEFWVE